MGMVRLDVSPDADVRAMASAEDVRNAGDLSDCAGRGGHRAPPPADRQSEQCSPNNSGTVSTPSCGFRSSAPHRGPGRRVVVLDDHRPRRGDPRNRDAGTSRHRQLREIQLYDGGADGLASTDDNTLFATQGIFVP